MGFGRKPSGIFVRGPVDAFKVRACCTLFAAAAHAANDKEVQTACLKIFEHFTGDCSYSDKGSGSGPYRERKWTDECIALAGHDPSVLVLIGVDSSVLAPL